MTDILKAAAEGSHSSHQAADADLGAVRYPATLIDTPDEATMSWFILAIAPMLDPAAVLLLLAATRG
jgi:hypothetical protein